MRGRFARVLAGPLGLTFLLSACASDGASTAGLPEPEECLPLETTEFTTASAYFGVLSRGQDQMRTAASDFLLRWPSRRFSRQEGFREDLAATSDRIGCIAERLRSARAPGARYEAYETAFDQLMTEYIEHMAVGREAARARNVSKYRDWLVALDALPQRLMEVRQQLER